MRSCYHALAAALLGAVALGGAGAAPQKAKLTAAQAEKAVKDHLDTLKGPAATVNLIKHAALERAAPGHHFFGVRYRQWPVAVRPPAGLVSSNVFAVGPDGKVQPFTESKALGKGLQKRLAPAKNDDQRKAAARAWLLLVDELHQDGFYKFALLDESFKVAATSAGIAASGKSVVMAGGNGMLIGTLLFTPAGELRSATVSGKVVPGPRPRCQATKLLDADPIVRQMAEDHLLIMGRFAKPYLDEQRAKASPELRRAIDRIWQRILEEDR